MSSISISRVHEPEFDIGLMMIPSMSYWHYKCHAILSRIHLHICDSISIVITAGFFSLLLLLCPLQMPQVSCVSICFVGTNSRIVSRTVVASLSIAEIDSLWHEWCQNDLNQLLCKCSWINGLKSLRWNVVAENSYKFPLFSINVIWSI